MTKKLFQILSLASISSFIFLFNSDDSRSCGWYHELDDYYKIFDENLVKAPMLEPLFLSEHLFHPFDQNSDLNERIANMKEWRSYFKNIPSLTDIDTIIYYTSHQDISELTVYLNSLPNNLRANLESNTLVGYLRTNKNPEFLSYLKFAKNCEPLVKYYNPEWQEPLRDTKQMRELIKDGLALFGQSKDKYIKLRFAFQIVRLAHYIKDYKYGLKLYRDLTKGLKVNSIINYWLLAHKAGMLKLTGKTAEGYYLFAKIFNECPSRRLIATENFRVPFGEFDSVYQKAKNDKEREVIIFLSVYKDNLRYYRLYKLNPKSQYLEIILIREIQKMERSLLPNKYYYYQNLEQIEREIPTYSYEYSDFYSRLQWINTIAGQENTLRPHLWYLASGYASILLNKPKIAEISLARAEKLWPKTDLNYLDRLKICEILNNISITKKLDKDFENKILKDLIWLKNYSKLNSKDAMVYVFYKLYGRYKSENNNLYANLCLGNFNSGYEIKENPYRYPIDELYSLRTNNNATTFEKFLLENYKYSKDDLLEIQGTKLISEFRFEEAISKFKAMRRSTDTLLADPFIIHIKDCHDCDYKLPKKKVYTKLSFAQRMLELENHINKESIGSAV